MFFNVFYLQINVFNIYGLIEDIHDLPTVLRCSYTSVPVFRTVSEIQQLIGQKSRYFHTYPAFNFLYFCYGDFRISSEKTVRRRQNFHNRFSRLGNTNV